MTNTNYSSPDLQRVTTAYWAAKRRVLLAGYAKEIDWQENLSPAQITESQLLCECAWVILCSGMRESVVRSRFDSISAAFLQWSSARAIISDAEHCRNRALVIFRHPGKIDAILRLATLIVDCGFNSIKEQLLEEGPGFLEQLPFIGPITVRHLAKNLGFPVAKPDRHLVRLATVLGYPSVDQLCADIAETTGQPIPVIDLVLWRYATLSPSYVAFFAGDRASSNLSEKV
jgi:hypothetical protein